MATLTAPSPKLSRLAATQAAIPVVMRRSFGGKLKLYLNLFRSLTLLLALSQMSSVVPKASLSISAVVIAASAYTVIKLFSPALVNRSLLSQAVLVSDLLFCAVLVWLTGGVSSPFLLYTLSPVLAASFFYDPHMVISVAVASVVDILLTQLANPFYNLNSGPLEFSFFFIYVVAVSLSASLPYLVNFNLQQRMQGEFVAEERRRLSHELHDGTVQVLTTLNWQAQIIERDLNRQGISLASVDRLLRLASESQKEARESLELLREYTDSGMLINHLKHYLNNLKQESGITYEAHFPDKEPAMEPHVELQILRICQEALTNIRKHSKASHIIFTLIKTKNILTVAIVDDGQGFDVNRTPKESTLTGHGLNVMRERAESAGGHFQLDSSPGGGTTLRIEVPLSR